jgi:hypothetical protein
MDTVWKRDPARSDRTILWSVNIYSRETDLEILIRLVRLHFGEDVTLLVHTTNEKGLELFKKSDADIVIHGPNTGHHNGVRDSYNATLPFVGDHDIVISSHADFLCSDFTVVDAIISKMANKRAAVITGGPRGAMDHDTHYGYFADFFLARADAFRKTFPMNVECDGFLWVEVELANHLIRALGKENIFDVPCVVRDRAHGRHDDNHTFESVLGDAHWWMSGSHDLASKLKRLKQDNPKYREAIRDIVP